MSKEKVNHRGMIRVFLHNEAPKIGSGWRKVVVVAGRKWCKLTCPFTGAKKKMRRSEWLPILKHAERKGHTLE